MDCLCQSGGFGLALEAKQKPNFIFIMVDDAGYGDFSCYGQKLFKTPNIDRLLSMIEDQSNPEFDHMFS